MEILFFVNVTSKYDEDIGIFLIFDVPYQKQSQFKLFYILSIVLALFLVHCSGSISVPLLWFYFLSIAFVLFPVHCSGSISFPLLWFNFLSIAVVLYLVHYCGTLYAPLLWFYFRFIDVALHPVYFCGSISCPLLWFYLWSIYVVIFPVHCCGIISSHIHPLLSPILRLLEACHKCIMDIGALLSKNLLVSSILLLLKRALSLSISVKNQHIIGSPELTPFCCAL